MHRRLRPPARWKHQLHPRPDHHLYGTLPQALDTPAAFRAFLAVEAEARRLGLAGIGLHVFGHNTGAQALYAKLGYVPTHINLYKPLADGGVASEAQEVLP